MTEAQARLIIEEINKVINTGYGSVNVIIEAHRIVMIEPTSKIKV